MERKIREDESVSDAVLEMTGRVRGDDPTDGEPLYDVVDPDALDELFVGNGSPTSTASGRVSFVYRDCHVTVENGDHVIVTPIRDDASAAHARLSKIR